MPKTPNNHPEQETHTQEPQGQATTEQEATPPWERDGEEFNPERAWALIQALRAEKEQLKTKAEQAAAAEPAQAPAEPAKEEGPEEPAKEEPAKAGKTESQDATAAELNKVRALAAAGVDIALAPYLPEGTPEELAEHIELLRAHPRSRGNTRRGLAICKLNGAHPRSRGEYRALRWVSLMRQGSSPLARGTL